MVTPNCSIVTRWNFILFLVRLDVARTWIRTKTSGVRGRVEANLFRSQSSSAISTREIRRPRRLRGTVFHTKVDRDDFPKDFARLEDLESAVLERIDLLTIEELKALWFDDVMTRPPMVRPLVTPRNQTILNSLPSLSIASKRSIFTFD